MTQASDVREQAQEHYKFQGRIDKGVIHLRPNVRKKKRYAYAVQSFQQISLGHELREAHLL